MELNIILTENLIKSYLYNNENNTEISKFFLNFYYHKESKTLHNSFYYKWFWLENQNNFYSGILKAVAKNKEFEIDGEKKNPFYFFDDELSKITGEFDNVNLIFADVNSSIKNQTIEYLKNKLKKDVETVDLAFIAAKKLVLSLSLPTPTDNMAVLVPDGANIHLYKASFDGKNISTKYVATLENANFPPFITALAQEILENIQRSYSVKLTTDHKKESIEYLALKLLRNEKDIKSLHKDNIVFESRLPTVNKRMIVRVEMSKVKIIERKIIKDLFNDICENASIDKNAKIATIDTINENLFNTIETLFNTVQIIDFQNITYLKNIDIQEIFNQNLTVFEEKKTDETEEISSLNINDLDIGWQVKLHTFDARPGKGEAFQFMEYLGAKKFVVIDSSRSLKTGDIAEATTDIWKLGDQIILSIYRSGKLYAKFKTREIKQIEILKEKN